MWARSISSRLLPAVAGACGGLRLEDEVLLAQLWLLRHDHGALDGILQFADIAHPGLLLQLVHGSGCDASDVLVHGEGELADEVFDERGNVFAALAQRGQFDAEDVEPVKQVRTECALFDHVLEILVGGGHAAEVDLDDLVAADAGDLALLQHAQQGRSASSG